MSNSHNLGVIDASLLGHEVKIAASIADQSASQWGLCCFAPGDVKLTLGTGAFLNINCGSECFASHHGLYPLIGWQVGDKTVYSIEGASNDCGNVVEWALKTGLIEDVNSSADVARSVPDSDGVYFIPAFSGLGAPFNNHKATSGFIGITPSSRKAHMLRALLESLVFRVALLIDCARKETKLKLSVIK